MDPVLEALLIGPTLMVAMLIFANFNRVNVKANNWLGVFVLCVFLIQLESPLDRGHYFQHKTFLLDLLSLVNYFVAPVFYFSVVHFIEPDRKWRLPDNLHFLFGFLITVLFLLTLFIDTQQVKTKEEKDLESKVVLVFLVIFCLQVLPYCIVAYIKISRYQKSLLLYASNIEKSNLGWLKKIVACIFLITVIWLTDGLFQISASSAAFDSISSVFNFIGICYIAYHALKQKEVFPYNTLEKKDIEAIIEATESPEATKKKLIPDDQLEAYKQKLAIFMLNEKSHLDYEISLVKLAAQFNVSPHQLSYIINNGFNENFFQFINRYRIEAAKKMILDPDMNHLNFIGIAFEVGFNSKTVFNTTFKKLTGQTPSEFKKNANSLI